MRERRALVPLLYAALFIIAANLVFMYLVTIPWSRKVKDLSELERERLARIAVEKKAYEDFAARKKALQGALGDVTAFFDRVVVGEKEVYERVRRALEKLADDSGLSITSISYASESHGPRQLQSMTLTFSITGTYEQVRKFLGGIERSNVFLCVDSVGLSSSGADQDNVAVNLRLSTLFKKSE